MKNIFRIATVSVFLTFAAFAVAQTTTSTTVPDLDNQVSKPQQMLISLGLNSDQATQVLDIYKKTITSAHAQKAQIALSKAQITLALTETNPDVKAIDVFLDKKSQQQATLEKFVIASKIQIHQIVGDDIYNQLEMYMEKHEKAKWNQHEPGHDGSVSDADTSETAKAPYQPASSTPDSDNTVDSYVDDTE